MKMATWKAVFLTFNIIYSVQATASAEDGEIKHSVKEGGRQSWAYATVRPGANMFWWLYYANVTEYTSRPLVIWLQGGPGASSTGFGNFMEIGPQDINFHNRTYAWNKEANVLFIDNPVGTGFSYVNDTSLLPKNNDDIAEDLITMLNIFLKRLTEFQKIPIHIFAESYGGKMAATFALKLQKKITMEKIKCKLAGLHLGDAWISPVDYLSTWPSYLFATSLLDEAGFSVVYTSAKSAVKFFYAQNYTQAVKRWSDTKKLIETYTNGVDMYNILRNNAITLHKTHQDSNPKKDLTPSQLQLSVFHDDKLSAFMNKKIKPMLRIVPKNIEWGGQSNLVFQALSEDFLKPVIHDVDTILNQTNLAVTVYNGQLDVTVDIMGTLQWIQKLKWYGNSKWQQAPRTPIVINGETQMFQKSYKNFNFFWILKSGHMVPIDAPHAAYNMFKRILDLKD